MTPETTLEEARRLVDLAVSKIPLLTSAGIGIHYSYYRQGMEAVTSEIQKQQAELYSDFGLRMVTFCADWLRRQTFRRTFNRFRTSYHFKHVIENHRRWHGDPDPYTYNGALIAAAVGLGLDFEIVGPNALFKLHESRELYNPAGCHDASKLKAARIEVWA
jgi:hypothetical protein